MLKDVKRKHLDEDLVKTEILRAILFSKTENKIIYIFIS
jgi:hypothetical protein